MAHSVIDRTWKWPDLCQAITEQGGQCSEDPETGDHLTGDTDSRTQFCHLHRMSQLRKYGEVNDRTQV